MAKKITAVISQGQSQHPGKRGLEEELVARLLIEPGIEVTVVPHLYDLSADGTGVLCLQGVTGDLVLFSWLYERASRWILNRNDIRGHEGQTLLKSLDDDDEGEDENGDDSEDNREEKLRVIDQIELPSRRIYCIDLRTANSVDTFVDEAHRILSEVNTQVVGLSEWVAGSPRPDALQRFQSPTNNTALGGTESTKAAPLQMEDFSVNDLANRIDESPARRWYPVIDFSRCTNCMECIDFCLFGVYGVDVADTILVEQPDNCRKGCPACSRVCPENAIIFPQHKSPAIAGSNEVAGSLKIDLSKLFGKPDEDPAMTAVRERDEQLLLAGREAVGTTVGLAKRQSEDMPAPKDELDDLIDELDGLDL